MLFIGKPMGRSIMISNLVLRKSVRRPCGYLPMGRCHFLTGCVLFWEIDPVVFGWEKVNPLCCGRGNFKTVYVVPVGICLFVVVKKENPTAS